MAKRFKQLSVTALFARKKWPFTDNDDFTDLLEKVVIHRFSGVEVEEHFYPAYYPYVAAGQRDLPSPAGEVNNVRLPHKDVMSKMVEDLTRESSNYDVLYWQTYHQCFPPVIREVRSKYDLTMGSFGDDCPGSSEIRSFPVVGYFDVAVHAMRTWSVPDRLLTADMYKKYGAKKLYGVTSGCSTGLTLAMKEQGGTIEERAKQIEAGKDFPIDLLFIGLLCPRTWRGQFLQELTSKLDTSGLSSHLYGGGMRDGILEPRDHKNGPGYTCYRAYQQAAMTLNIQLSGLYNTRLNDAWACGVPQLIWDPCGDMKALGAYHGQHYIAFDGTVDGLIRTVKDWLPRRKALASIVRQGYGKYKECLHERVFYKRLGYIYRDVFGIDKT